jgi:hypothetical protein
LGTHHPLYNKGYEPNAKDATKPIVLRIWYLSSNKNQTPLEQPTLEEETSSTISKMKQHIYHLKP